MRVKKVDPISGRVTYLERELPLAEFGTHQEILLPGDVYRVGDSLDSGFNWWKATAESHSSASRKEIVRSTLLPLYLVGVCVRCVQTSFWPWGRS